MENEKRQRRARLMDTFPRFLFVALFSVIATLAFAQNKTVTGTIVDSTGEPIIGASIIVDGTTNGTITDFDGNFSLTNVPNSGKLKVSYIGYVPQEVTVAGKNSFNIILKEDAQALDEVVVVGYGTVKKSDVTGALTQVGEKQIKQMPVQNAIQAMQGRASGVDVTTNSRPGELGEIRIRGNRSLLADNDPLYVVDGIPMTAGSMNDINPNDIESMEILKDASATAIYGSRGANGVILVTTKKGKTGRVSINYDGSFTFSQLHSLTDWMNAGEQLDYQRLSAVNGGKYGSKYGTAPDPDADRAKDNGLGLGTESYMDRIIQSAYQYDSNGNIVLRPATAAEKAMGYADQVPVYDSSKIPTTDWGDLVTRTAFTQNHQVSLSAGTETSRIYMSLAYLDQEVPMKDQNFRRYTVNINGEIKPMKWLTVGMGLNANHSIKNYGIVENSSNTVAKDSYGMALNLMPYAPAFDEDGKILSAATGVSQHNVLHNIGSAKNEYRYYGLMFSSFAEAEILPWLKWRTNFGAQYRNSRQGSYYGDEFTNPYGFEVMSPGAGYNKHSQNLSWTLENLIYMNKTFNDIHTVNVTLMQSAERYRVEGLNLRGYEIVYPTSLWYDLGNSNKNKAAYGSNFSTWSRASYMARFNYSLMDKYLLTLTGRYDGASMLAAGHKWDFFPSAALAWKMNEEEFMKGITWINQLKLRVGYGVTGNSAVSPYSTAGSVTSTYGKIPFGVGSSSNTTGTKTDVMPNNQLGWEKTSSTNFGVDFSVLNSRISGSVEYYIAKTSDLLMNRSIPIITGYGQIKDNIGKTENKGLEISLTTRNIQNRDFSWTTDFTFATNSEKITELADGVTKNTANKWFVGSPINVFYDYKYDRIWGTSDADKRMMAIYKANSLTFLPGQYKAVDQPLVEVPKGTEGAITKKITVDGVEQEVTYMDNGFGVFNDDDKVVYRKSPKWTGGINNTFTYKDFTLNFFTYFRFGNTYYGLTQTVGRRVEKDLWTPENQGARYAQPTSASYSKLDENRFASYTKGNMIAIRNIALSYNIPQNLLNKVGAQSAQVYAQVLNPFIFGGKLVKEGINPDDITGWDAGNFIGGQTNNTAITRSFVLGVRLGF